jgi:hypothetical protein
MLKRLADPNSRAKIVAEVEEAMAARFGGAPGVYLPRTQQQLTDIMATMKVGAGEAVLRTLEQAPDTSAILRFGSEDDLVKILKDPITSMACDCGASTATRTHPRYYGSFPRVLGRYVREQRIMSWEEVIRKSTWLPASTIGMSDRGLIAAGMAADITVFDPKTIIDRATYEDPALLAVGVRFVLVNGHLAVKDGLATGEKGGRGLARTANMPSRPANASIAHSVAATGTIDGQRISINVSQPASAQVATGTVSVPGVGSVSAYGRLQVTANWASLSFVSDGRAHVLTLDAADPSSPSATVLRLDTDGVRVLSGSLPSRSVTVK